MTFDRYLMVPVIRTFDLRERIDYVRVTFTFKDLCLVPKQVITGTWKASRESVMWSVLKWGLPAEQFAMMDDMPLSAVREQLSWWQEQSGITLDELVGVIRSATSHRSEIEYDLIDRGLRLRNCPSEEFNWRDLLVIIKHSDPHTRIFRATHPDAAGWDKQNQLLAELVDIGHWLQWAKTESAQDPDSAPDPIPRPGVIPKEDGAVAKAGKVKPMTIDRAREVFARPPVDGDGDNSKRLYQLFRGN